MSASLTGNELCVKGGQINQLHMDVVSHSYGGFSRDRVGGCSWKACWTKPGGIGLFREKSEHFPSVRWKHY